MEHILDISIDGLKELGRGATSIVYQLDDEKIIKVYYPWMKREDIEKERNSSRSAFIKGIPTAITFHLARVGDSFGVIYELVDADTLAGAMGREPGQMEHYAREAAGILGKLHHTVYNKGELPDTRDSWWKLYEMGLNRFLSDEEGNRIHEMIYGLPERNTFIHGDYHAFNIMVRNGELILIDVGDASAGDPVLDLACTYMACMILPEQSKLKHTMNLVLSPEEWKQFWRVFFDRYMELEEMESGKDLYEKKIERFALLRMSITRALIPGMTDDEKKESIRLLIDRVLEEE